jgi:MFS family permease
MFTVVARISSLLLGIGVLLVGMGLLGTLLAVRARLEGFSEVTVGWVMSAYFVGFVGGTFICPGLIRRVGHIRAFAAMGTVASAVAVLHALWVHPAAWFTLRVVNGVCIVGLYMVMESWLNVLVPNDRRATLLGAYNAVTLVAMGLGQFLLLTAPVQGFDLFGVAAVLISLALVPVALTRVAEPRPVEAPRVSLAHLWRQSPLGLVGGAVAGLVNGAFWGMGAVFAHHMGMSTLGVAGFMGATIMGGALLQWPVGRLSDRHDRRTVLAAVCALGAVLALAALGVSRAAPEWLAVPAFLYGGMVFTVYGMSVAHVNDHVPTDETLEAARGMLLVYGLGAVGGPVLGGLCMKAWGPGALLGFLGACLALLAAFVAYRKGRRAGVPVDEQAAFVPLLRTSQAAFRIDPRVEDVPAPEEEPGPPP